MTEVEGLCLLLEKPSEPLIVPKGNKDVFFDMPDNFYNDGMHTTVNVNNADHVIRIKNISIPFDLIKEAMQIEKAFSHFIPKHMEIAEKLIDLFSKAQDLDELLSLAAYCRERIHPVLFNYVLSVVVLHRQDTSNIKLPNFLLSFPGRFIEASVFADIRTEASLLTAKERQPFIINKNFTASDREPEQAVAYFREDLGINLHHWHWHLVYPTRGSAARKDRRGELFYYMHEQILARYNTERLCNKLEMVKSIQSLRDSIPEAYFSKLSQIISDRHWPPRCPDTYLYNLDRPSDGLSLDVSDVEEWLDSVKQGIRDGFVYNVNLQEVKLDPVTGIDILGNLVEASSLSVNSLIYGNIHNMGHILIAYCHDPNDRFLESFSIMGDVSTAMRDPIFYRWHSTINDLFVSHKKSLPPYTVDELDFANITITNLQLEVQDRGVNVINTFWELNDIDISRGLDFVAKEALLLRIMYLQHGQFTYTIEVENSREISVKGTVRIFMAPKYDLTERVHLFETERQLMIEMDKFTVDLKPGANTIQRYSYESSVTINYETTYRNVDTTGDSRQTFCGCGWPDNMLVPKGTAEGYEMNLFAMISDYNEDRIIQNPPDVCPSADSYCGLFSRKYPDKRSMGYPFDRPATDDVVHLPDFLLGNMKVVSIKIKHENKRVSRQTFHSSPGIIMKNK